MKRKVFTVAVLITISVPAFAGDQPNQHIDQQQVEDNCRMRVNMALEAIKATPDTGEEPNLHGLTTDRIKTLVAEEGVCAAAREIAKRTMK